MKFTKTILALSFFSLLSMYSPSAKPLDRDIFFSHPRFGNLPEAIAANCRPSLFGDNGADDDHDGYCPGVDTNGDGKGDTCNDPTLEAGDCRDEPQCADSASYEPSTPPDCDSPQDFNCDGWPDYQDTINCPQNADLDGDGYCLGVDTDGDTVSDHCAQAEDQVGDCDDNNAAVNPAAEEVCGNTVDENCSLINEDASDDDDEEGALWYKDVDSDGFGNPAGESQRFCPENEDDKLEGFADNNTDCDDAEDDGAKSKPRNQKESSLEECKDGFDNDCSGLKDGDDPSCLGDQLDKDGDGFNSNPSEGNDCDDNNPNINPSIVDMCDGTDNNCNAADDDLKCFGDLAEDDDGDGFSEEEGDCDDTPFGAGTHPNAAEVCGDKINNNCDDAVDEAIACLEPDKVVNPTRMSPSTGGCTCNFTQPADSGGVLWMVLMGLVFFVSSPLIAYKLRRGSNCETRWIPASANRQ